MLRLSREQFAWSLMSWANHGFATTVLVGFFPLFFARHWAAGLPGTTSTFWLGATNSAASFAVMLLAPTLGTLADRRGWKKPLLALFTALGVLATALLVNVARREETDRISAISFAFGYLGGGLLFLVNVAMALRPQWFGLADAASATRWAFGSVAVWWALFALPLFRAVPEGAPRAAAGVGGWLALRATFREVLGNRPVFRFLLAYWLYIDAIGTLQQMAVDFGAKLGFSTSALIGALLLVQFVSFPAAWAFGPLAARIGTRRAIHLGLGGFVLITLGAWFLQTERDFYVMAALVALVQGGVQALSRSYFARLIPDGRAGEYFGFYNMLGKFAAVLGPLVVGTVALLTGNQRLSILVLAAFFIGGAWLLARVAEPDAPRGR